MGACGTRGMKDAYGTWLEEGSWVECTSNGTVDTRQGTGKIERFRADDLAFFSWPGWGTYVYGEADILYYGMRKIMADREGKKLKTDQLVKTADGLEGVVADVGEYNVTFMFAAKDWNGKRRTYRQADIEAYGIKVAGTLDSLRDRQCVGGACF
mmetsp:Transcript_98740/g.247446  ORF Transcript_98740/g.247446 Transcript_98740/m.247446 type:complete len:154 (-) Transcript_98740:108-569(-)